MDPPEELPLPSWFSPLRLLLLFSGMSFLVYVDRGAALIIKRASPNAALQRSRFAVKVKVAAKSASKINDDDKEKYQR